MCGPGGLGNHGVGGTMDWANDGVCDTEEWGDGGIGGTEIGQIAVRVALTVGGISLCKWHSRLGK